MSGRAAPVAAFALLLAVLTAIAGGAAFLGRSERLVDPRTALIAAFLIPLIWIDLDRLTLPDWLTWPLLALGIGDAVLTGGRSWIDAALGAALGLGLLWAISEYYWRVRRVDALGLGDAKLAGAAGAWLGWFDLPALLLAASLIGLVMVGLAALRAGRFDPAAPIPFGPALAVGFWGLWLFGPVFAPLS